jgi:hypothetical protein
MLFLHELPMLKNKPLRSQKKKKETGQRHSASHSMLPNKNNFSKYKKLKLRLICAHITLTHGISEASFH